jgi:hypothetical protein
LTFHDAAFQSDHRPVCAGFRLDTNMPYVALLDQVGVPIVRARSRACVSLPPSQSISVAVAALQSSSFLNHSMTTVSIDFMKFSDEMLPPPVLAYASVGLAEKDMFSTTRSQRATDTKFDPDEGRQRRRLAVVVDAIAGDAVAVDTIVVDAVAIDTIVVDVVAVNPLLLSMPLLSMLLLWMRLLLLVLPWLLLLVALFRSYNWCCCCRCSPCSARAILQAWLSSSTRRSPRSLCNPMSPP